MKKLSLATLVAATALGAATAALPAHAQSGGDGDQQNARQGDSQRQRQAQQRQNRQRSQQRNQQSAQWRLKPMGWVTVAVDYNDDDSFDAYETIYYYDLQQAQQRSQQRRGQQGQMANRQQGRQQGRQAGQQPQRVRVQGEVQQRKKLDLVGDQHKDVVVAKLRTQNGKDVSVYLGAVERVSQLDIQQGDQITVEGVKSKINDEPFIIARRVSTGDQSITNPMPRQQGLRRCEGEIASLRTEKFKGRDGQYLVARLETDQGRTRTVNLGRKDKLERLDLQEGDQITALVRSGRVGGEQALIAQLVRANDRTVDVRSPNRDRMAERNRDSQR